MNSLKIPLLLPWLALLLNPSLAAIDSNQSVPVFTGDTFGTVETWEFTDPDAWRIKEGDGSSPVLSLVKAGNYEPSVRSPLNIAWLRGIEASDFVLEVEAESTSREYGHRDLCFFFGKQSDTEFYYAHLATAADPHAHSIFLVNNQDRVSISEKRTKGVHWKNNHFHRIRIERRTDSGSIKVFFDDMEQPVMETKDKTFLSGSFGLGSFDDTGNFRNLRIYKLEN